MTIEVREWYSKKNILITGATGFMGLVLVEKILRSIPHVGKIYIVVRPKHNLAPEERLTELLSLLVFDKIKEQKNHETLFSKIQCLQGDVGFENLGLNDADLKEIRQHCNIVIHMAACIRFDQPLKSAMNMNVAGTLNMLELAKTMEKLISFVHVSTAYCHSYEKKLKDEFYTAPHPSLKVLEMVNWMDDELVDVIAPKLLNLAPNTYSYTKCLAENLVSDYHKVLPLVIVRPSIVIAAYKEPMPGWIQNMNNLTGVIVGGGKGLIRSLHCNGNYRSDIIPVDIVINGIILSAWEIGKKKEKPNDITVINLCRSNDNPITWDEFIELAKLYVKEYPFSTNLWYLGGTTKSNYFHHMITVIFLQYLPAYILDFLLNITGNKPFLVRTQDRIATGQSVLRDFLTREWKFSNSKLKQIAQSLKGEEREIFYTDQMCIEWKQYILNYILGIRKYCLKEDPSNLPQARKTMKKFYYLHVTVKYIFFGLLLWILTKSLQYLIKIFLK